jgi:hypothetical protein
MRHYEVMLMLDPSLEDKDGKRPCSPHLWMGVRIYRLYRVVVSDRAEHRCMPATYRPTRTIRTRVWLN